MGSLRTDTGSISSSCRLLSLAIEYELELAITKEDLLAVMINERDVEELLSHPVSWLPHPFLLHQSCTINRASGTEAMMANMLLLQKSRPHS